MILPEFTHNVTTFNDLNKDESNEALIYYAGFTLDSRAILSQILKGNVGSYVLSRMHIFLKNVIYMYSTDSFVIMLVGV